ncbi:uncharacterized protein LOC144904177 isoform X2 [Branchiostoma floridae x Branchiostoma belcheri]
MGKGERLTAVLTGGPPWGFRLSGGLEVKQPLKVAKVRKKSKAHGSGLQEGDELLTVNGAPCQDFTHKDCMGIVEGATDRLELEVLRKRPTYNVQPAGQATEQEESGSKLEIKVNSVAKKDSKQHVSTLQIKPVTVSASSVKQESRREVSAITVAKEESSRQSQVVRSTESEYSTLERKSKNVSKVNGLGQVSVFSGSARSEEEKSEERKVQGFSYLKPGDIRSLGQSSPQEDIQRKAPPPAARPSQEEFPANPPPSYSRALAEPQYQQVYSPTSGQPGGQPFEEEPPSSAFRSVRPPGQQGQGINSQSGPLPRQQQQIHEPQAVTSTQPAVQRPTPIRQQPAAVYQPERPAGSPHTWSAGVPKQEPVPAPQPAAQQHQPAGSYPFEPPTPTYSQPPASAPTHTWNPTVGRSKPKTPITPTTPTEVAPNKVFSVFDAGATWEPPEEDERQAGNMMNAKPKAPMFKVKKFDFKPQTWSEGSSSGRPMTQEDFQTMDLPLGPMGQYRNKQREMLAYEKSGAVWSPSGTTPVSGPKSWSPGGGDVQQERPYEVREVREQPWSPTGRPQAPQPQSPQPAPAVWSPSGGGGGQQAPRAAQPVSFQPGGPAGDHGGPQPTSNGVWRPSQMPPSSQGYYSGERDSGIWSPTGTHATASSRSFNDTDGHHSPASFDPRPKMVSSQSSSARSAAAGLKKPGDITPVPTGDKQPGPALVATGPVVMNGTVHVNLEWQNEPETRGYGVRTPATITLAEEPLKVSDEEDLYPPEERYKIKICHRLARALLSRHNRFSRGGRMFWKRRLRAHKWEADPFGPAVHPRDATPQEFRPGVDVPDVPEDLYQLVLEEIREGPADDDADETDFDYPYNSPGAPGRGGKAVGPTRVGPLPSYLDIQEEQARNASEHFMTVKPTPALTSTKDTSKQTLQTLPTRSYLEIQKEAKPEPENTGEKKQKQRLHPKSISEYYNLPPEAALPEKDTTKRIPVSEIEPINFNVDLEDKSRCTHQTPEMLSHDAARRLAEATFFEEGKGANMFMKRMERMSKYVIDESNVKKAPPKPQVSPNVPQYQYQKQQQRQSTPTVQEMKEMMSQVTYKKPPKSPWEAAMEGSGKIDDAFSHIRGNKLLLDMPAGSQPEYDPFDPTLPFPGAQPADVGVEGAPSWASQDGMMMEKPSSPTGPQYKDFNLKPRGWVSSGGGYLSDQLATDYESDTNLSTASAPAPPRQLFKVSKVPTAAGTARDLRPQHLYLGHSQPPQQRSMSPVRPLTPQRPATPPYWQSSRSSTPPYWQRKATPPELPRAPRSHSRSPGPGAPATSSWRHTIPRSDGKPKPKSPTKAPTPFTVAALQPSPSPRAMSPVDASWRRTMSLTTPDYGGVMPEKSPTHFTQANFLHSRQHIPMEKLGKGAKMFQKQKERSEKFVIDENTVARTPVRRAERERSSSSSSSSHVTKARLTPWEAAATMGTVDPAFSGIDVEMKVHGSPYKARVAHAVMDAAGTKAMPAPPEEWKRTQMNGQQWSPTVASYVTKPRFNARQMSMSPTIQPARVTPFAFTYNPSIKAWSPQHSMHESEE